MLKMTENQMAGRYLHKSFNGSLLPFKILLICFVLSPYFCTTVNSQMYEDKKSDPSRPFYMGSRYGRSGQQTQVQVTPRVDRFFLGSRYGKRASGSEFGEVFSPYVGASSEFQDGDISKIIGDQEWGKTDANTIEAIVIPDSMHPRLTRMLKCSYMGKGNLYNCFTRDINPLSLL